MTHIDRLPEIMNEIQGLYTRAKKSMTFSEFPRPFFYDIFVNYGYSEGTSDHHHHHHHVINIQKQYIFTVFTLLTMKNCVHSHSDSQLPWS
jgi:hypothetical protein